MIYFITPLKNQFIFNVFALILGYFFCTQKKLIKLSKIITIIFPSQIVKTRLIVGKYTNTMDVVVKTYKSGGVSAFFRGFWPGTLSIFLFAGIDLMTYEHIKENYSYFHEKDDRPSWIVNFYSAFISNILCVVIFYPISTVITRLQVDDGQSLTIIILITF